MAVVFKAAQDLSRDSWYQHSATTERWNGLVKNFHFFGICSINNQWLNQINDTLCLWGLGKYAIMRQFGPFSMNSCQSVDFSATAGHQALDDQGIMWTMYSENKRKQKHHEERKLGKLSAHSRCSVFFLFFTEKLCWHFSVYTKAVRLKHYFWWAKAHSWISCIKHLLIQTILITDVLRMITCQQKGVYEWCSTGQFPFSYSWHSMGRVSVAFLAGSLIFQPVVLKQEQTKFSYFSDKHISLIIICHNKIPCFLCKCVNYSHNYHLCASEDTKME